MRFYEKLLLRASTIVPPLAAMLYQRLWFSTHRHTLPVVEQQLVNTARLKELHLPNRVVSYQWGDGPSILLVHGWNGRGTQMVAMIKRFVEAGFRVVAFDAPGHGASGGDSSSLFEFARAIKNIGEDEGRFHAVVTHSFGGLVAAYSISQSELITERLITIGSPTSLHELFDGWSMHLNLSKSLRERIKQRIEKHFGQTIWDRTTVQKLAPGCDLPVLVIHDRDDHELPVAFGERYAKAWKNSQFVATQGLGHRRVLKSKNVIERILAFIQ